MKTLSPQTISDAPIPQLDTPNQSDFGSNQLQQQQISEGKQVASDTPLLDALNAKPSAAQGLDPALEGKFEVIADGVTPTRENQVTSSELAALSALCARIRKGECALGISRRDTHRKAGFLDQTLQELGFILQTKVGRKLVTNLAEQDAGAHPTEISASNTPVCLSNDGAPQVSYDDTQLVSKPNESGDEWSKKRRDVTLFHELTHAYHVVNGTYDEENLATEKDGVSPQDVGVKLEEIATVGLVKYANDEVTENAYRAARKRLAGGKGEREGDATMVRRDSYSPSEVPS